MDRRWWLGMGVMMLLVTGSAAWGQRMGGGGMGMEVGPDPTPLLWDRVRTYPVVIVGTLEEGFEKKTQPQRGTNGVLMTVQVNKVLKGVVGKEYQISIHGQAPAILAKRDAGVAAGGAGVKREYLLALAAVKEGVGHLGTASVYDTERFYVNDAGLERVVGAFLAATDDSPAGTLKVGVELLLGPQGKDLGAGLAPVQELLGRAIRQVDGKDFQALGKDKIAALAAAAQRGIIAGEKVGGWAEVLVALSKRTDVPADVTVLPESLKAPLRKWLEGEVDRVGDNWPTLPEQQRARAVISLLGDLKDADAKDVLVKVGSHAKWAQIRRDVTNTLVVIFGPEGRELLPGGGMGPGGRVRPIMR